MFRLWVKEMQDLHLLRDTVIKDSRTDVNRTTKVLEGLEKACAEFDLQVPIWLEVNIADFKRTAKARFTQDSFIEHIDFDYLEIHVIEEG